MPRNEHGWAKQPAQPYGPAATADRLLRRLRRLGYDVTIATTPDVAAPMESLAAIA